MTSWARPGVKVVCVVRGEETSDVNYPIVGEVYTIRQVEPHPLGGVGILFEEVSNHVMTFDSGRRGEPLFMASRFRPLVTKTQNQDVALFRHLLTKQGVDA